MPEAANFGVRVAGDSMEPRFHSGQTVWVHQQPTLVSPKVLYICSTSDTIYRIGRKNARKISELDKKTL